MKTENLISALAADAQKRGPDLNTVWLLVMLSSLALAVFVFFLTIGPRPDIAQAAQTLRFDFKFVLTVSLAVTAFLFLRALAVPGAKLPPALLLALAPALGLAGVVAEMITLPGAAWQMAAQGKNALVCLAYIPLIGIGPLVLLALGLRQGAPTRPVLAGAMTGLVAGGIAATLYAAHCTDDSPMFVMTWYPLSIAILAAAGAMIGRVFARW